MILSIRYKVHYFPLRKAHIYCLDFELKDNNKMVEPPWGCWICKKILFLTPDDALGFQI